MKLMFGYSLLKTEIMEHLTSEVAKLAIENVRLQKANTRMMCELTLAAENMDAVAKLLQEFCTAVKKSRKQAKKLHKVKKSKS